jgi:hypothetical protein
VHDKGLDGVIQVGMFDDTGAYQGTRNIVDGLPPGTRFDLADHTSWRFFWDHNMKVWFDTIPDPMLYKVNGRPVVAFWTLSSYFFQNQSGNASQLLDWLRGNMLSRYGLDPIFVVDGTWLSEDPTITTTQAQGANDWFDPSQSTFTVKNFGGAQWGALVPSYRNPDTDPGCGAACREQPRNDGNALRKGLSANRGSSLTLLEGFTNIIESAGFYRSDAWRIPNLYLDVTREAVDFETETLRYEAEAADGYSDTTPGNQGGVYRGGDLDVGPLADGTGWFVGWTDAGEWLEFQGVHLSCGTYRWNARVASPGGATVHLEVDGRSLGAVVIPPTGGWDAWSVVRLGETPLAEGRHSLRFVFDTGGSNLDWFFHRKLSGSCVQDRPLLAEHCPAGLADRGSYSTPSYGSDITASDFLDRPFPGIALHFCHQGTGLVIAANACPAGYTKTSSLSPDTGASFVDSSGVTHPAPAVLAVCTQAASAFFRIGSCPSGARQTGLVYAPRKSAGTTVTDDTGASAQGTWAAFCSQ